MFYYKLTISYVGSGYLGWQSQPGGKTVQDALEAAMSVYFREKIVVRGASRTDAGVHAEGQVAVVSVKGEVADFDKAMRSINAMLPQGIAVLGMTPVNRDFHPIGDCVAKIYRYRLWLGRSVSPFVVPYCWSVHRGLDLCMLTKNLELLPGSHDFSSFCASDSDARSKVRTILQVRLVQHGPLIDIWLLGDGFLKQMVRSLIGTLVGFGLHKYEGWTIIDMINARDRRCSGPTAPAHGLSLVEVFYGSVPPIENVILNSSAGFSWALPSV